MTKLTLDRVSNLVPAAFVKNYLSKNEPVIVTDALDSWPALSLWTPEFFKEQFGEVMVSLQGSSFSENSIQSQDTISNYIDAFPAYQNMVSSDEVVTKALPYLRYSSKDKKMNAVDFNDLCIEKLQDHWSRPYFLPSNGYLYPFDLFHSDPTCKRYPDFGVYISPRGAITQLHVDGDLSNAVLCQLHGHKKYFLFPQEYEPSISKYLERKNIGPVHLQKTPQYDGAKPLEGILNPGEVLFIPRGWLHEVYTISHSVSLTYNFVHTKDAFKTFGFHKAWPKALINRRFKQKIHEKFGAEA
jgi:hypothetical protein